MKIETMDAYIKAEPPEAQKVLKKMRSLVNKVAPKATEKIAWGMPTFYLEGNLLTFGAFKKHMGIFPGADTILAFKKHLKGYSTSKGTIQIPYDQSIPVGLIGKIIRYRAKQNLAKAAAKKKLKPKKKIAARRAK